MNQQPTNDFNPAQPNPAPANSASPDSPESSLPEASFPASSFIVAPPAGTSPTDVSPESVPPVAVGETTGDGAPLEDFNFSDAPYGLPPAPPSYESSSSKDGDGLMELHFETPPELTTDADLPNPEMTATAEVPTGQSHVTGFEANFEANTANVTENVITSGETPPLPVDNFSAASGYGPSAFAPPPPPPVAWETTSSSIEPPTAQVPPPPGATPVAPPQKSNLGLRIITALIGIPIVAFLVWRAESGVFIGAVTLLAIIGLRELSRALRAARMPLVSGLAYPSLVVLMMAQPIIATNVRWGALLIWMLPFLLLFGLLINGVLRYPSRERVTLPALSLTLFATLYVGLFAFLILLRSLRDSPFDEPALGPSLLWLTLVSVWSGDIVAYFVGRSKGREKLTPLSPGKTWEGAVGGLVATIAVCVPVSRLLHLEIRDGLALGVVIALAAPLGDLAESFWKRELQVKDMGGVLPGHGGILDRCDSLLFAAFAVYIYAQIFMM